MAEDNTDNLFNDIQPPVEPEVLEPSEPTSLVQATTSTNLVQMSPLVLPQAVQTAAESSISLRAAQNKLVDILTREEYVASIAANKPEVLPCLVEALTGAINVSDNLFLKTAQTAEKSASTNRILDYLTRQLDAQNQQQAEVKHSEEDEAYSKSIEQIKKAIYGRLNEERDAEGHATSEDFKNPQTEVEDE